MSEWNAMTFEAKDNLLRVVRREAEGMFAMAEQPDAWERPTMPPGWEVRDVIAHLVDVTESYFVAFDSARGGPAVPDAYGVKGMAARLDEKSQEFRSQSQSDMMARVRSDFEQMMSIEEGLTVLRRCFGP